jgi:signal transduction histidine kinase
MRTEKSPDRLVGHSFKDIEDQYVNSGVLITQAIENADGVPFQLIFGPWPGEGYYLNVGAGIKQLLGVSPENFTEKGYHSMIEKIVPLSEDVPLEFSEWRKKFISGEMKSYKAEVLIKMPGGERKWIQDSSLPLLDEETGKVIGAFGILFDIDEQKRMFDSLGKAKEKAEESDRLKNAFLHNLSHEVRTPLNAIVGFSSLLCENETDPEIRHQFVDAILRSSDHLLEIIDEIVEISNIEAKTVQVNIEAVNLNKALRKVYEGFKVNASEKNILLSFVTELSDAEAFFSTDSYKFSRILSNLVANAIKFTAKGEVKFGYSITDNMIEFYVSDTGIGVSKEHYPLIFNRFYQADHGSTRQYEGIGVGLSISRAYTELLGGEIWFKSKPDEGSVFYFTLPFTRVGV